MCGGGGVLPRLTRHFADKPTRGQSSRGLVNSLDRTDSSFFLNHENTTLYLYTKPKCNRTLTPSILNLTDGELVSRRVVRSPFHRAWTAGRARKEALHDHSWRQTPLHQAAWWSCVCARACFMGRSVRGVHVGGRVLYRLLDRLVATWAKFELVACQIRHTHTHTHTHTRARARMSITHQTSLTARAPPPRTTGFGTGFISREERAGTPVHCNRVYERIVDGIANHFPARYALYGL